MAATRWGDRSPGVNSASRNLITSGTQILQGLGWTPAKSRPILTSAYVCTVAKSNNRLLEDA